MCEFFRSPLHYPLPGWGPSPSTETLDLIIGGTGVSFLLGRKLLPRLALPFLSSSLPRQTKEDEKSMSIALCLSNRMQVSFVPAPPFSTLPSRPQCTFIPTTAVPSHWFSSVTRSLFHLSLIQSLEVDKVALQIQVRNISNLHLWHLWQEFLWQISNLPLYGGLEASLRYYMPPFPPLWILVTISGVPVKSCYRISTLTLQTGKLSLGEFK